ncbi:MAG: NADH-quinone oxidoreductase subunit C [Anaerolineae bacterium]|nr:NADH-quinone oxidoreductase subunit C [Anaerolineae bacterium]
MNTDTALQAASELLTAWTLETSTPEPDRLDVVMDAGNLLAAVRAIDSADWGYLAGITGLDLGTEAGQFLILYHFCASAAVLTLRVSVPREAASVPSICDVLPPASFYERELREMMGIEVVGLPNPDHLFLPDDWPDGVYPLRKDAQLDS